MIEIIRSAERGHFNYGWLDTNHTFSFGDYINPTRNQFRSLRVLNEDRVQPGEGFPSHPHREMEIITYVVDGALSHRDSLGNTSLTSRDEVQVISAGAGITHSEFNDSYQTPVHFLQIWIRPNGAGLTPSYQHLAFPENEKRGQLRLICSPTQEAGSAMVHQDVLMYGSILGAGESILHRLTTERFGWVQVVSGELDLLTQQLSAGDGAAIIQETDLVIKASTESEFLLFDLG